MITCSSTYYIDKYNASLLSIVFHTTPSILQVHRTYVQLFSWLKYIHHSHTPLSPSFSPPLCVYISSEPHVIKILPIYIAIRVDYTRKSRSWLMETIKGNITFTKRPAYASRSSFVQIFNLLNWFAANKSNPRGLSFCHLSCTSPKSIIHFRYRYTQYSCLRSTIRIEMMCIFFLHHRSIRTYRS